MEIQLNGATFEIAETCTVAMLIEQLELTQKRLAIELNLDIVPRSRYAQQYLQAGDRIEIVHAIGGG